MKILTLISAVFFITSCSCTDNNEGNENTNKDSLTIVENNMSAAKSLQNASYLKDTGDSLVIDPFEIDVALSEKAKGRIINSNETIIASIFFYGYPKDKLKANSEKDGELYLVGDKKEVTYGQPIRFVNLKVSRKDYNQLIDKDFKVNLNIYSGGKSSENNLLDCETLFGKVSTIVNKKHTLKGKLIYGDD